jgi:hypothetical protein
MRGKTFTLMIPKHYSLSGHSALTHVNRGREKLNIDGPPQAPPLGVLAATE